MKIRVNVARVQALVEQIGECFSRPVRLTLICREEGNSDAEFCLTDDDLDEAVAALQRAKTREAC